MVAGPIPGVIRRAYVAYQAMKALRPAHLRQHARFLGRPGPDGLPLPGPVLMAAAAGTPEIGWFLEGGRLAAETIRETLGRHGMVMDELGALLDLGCGCGRVIRHWYGLEAVEIHGCDVNRAAVAWCRRHLTFAGFEATGLEPPLPFADATFNLVYALSVFTHLPGPLQTAWAAELCRVVGPGGWILLTTHGETYLERLDAEGRAAFRRGELVVTRGDVAGTNTCGAYHPTAYVETTLAAGLEVVDHLPRGARGNPEQDVWLLRRPMDSPRG